MALENVLAHYKFVQVTITFTAAMLQILQGKMPALLSKFNNRCDGVTFYSTTGVAQLCGVRCSRGVKVTTAFWRGYHMYTGTKNVLARRKDIKIVQLPWFLYNSPFIIHAIITTLELSATEQQVRQQNQSSTYFFFKLELYYLPKMYTYPNRSKVFKKSPAKPLLKPLGST